MEDERIDIQKSEQFKVENARTGVALTVARAGSRRSREIRDRYAREAAYVGRDASARLGANCSRSALFCTLPIELRGSPAAKKTCLGTL